MERVRTETGSLYEIDRKAKTWARVEQPRVKGAYPLRTANGVFHSCSDARVGTPLVIMAEPLDPAMSFRMIQTSNIVEVL